MAPLSPETHACIDPMDTGCRKGEGLHMKSVVATIGKGAATAVVFVVAVVGIGALVITQAPKIERMQKNG